MLKERRAENDTTRLWLSPCGRYSIARYEDDNDCFYHTFLKKEGIRLTDVHERLSFKQAWNVARKFNDHGKKDCTHDRSH